VRHTTNEGNWKKIYKIFEIFLKNQTFKVKRQLSERKTQNNGQIINPPQKTRNSLAKTGFRLNPAKIKFRKFRDLHVHKYDLHLHVYEKYTILAKQKQFLTIIEFFVKYGNYCQKLNF